MQPKSPLDLALAPVAAAIDLNLQRLRDKPGPAVEEELQLELDRPAFDDTPGERAARIFQAALRHVDLHGWRAHLTDDQARIRLTGGSVSIDLGLGAALTSFINNGEREPTGTR